MFQRVPQAINDGMRQVQQISQVTLLSWQLNFDLYSAYYLWADHCSFWGTFC